MAKKPIERFASYDDLIAALDAAAPDCGRVRRLLDGAPPRRLVNLGIAAILVALLGWAGVVVHLLHITIGHAYWGVSTSGRST